MPRTAKGLTPGWKSYRGNRNMTARVSVKRSFFTKQGAFESCVTFGKGPPACAVGKNPRAAVAAAFHLESLMLRTRSGAFAGMARRRKRRRR